MKYLLILLSLLVPAVSTAQPPQWPLCSACHGMQGQGGVGPMLAGQTAEYISARLKAYREGEYFGEQSPLMWPNAANLSNEDIEVIAIFIESLDQDN